MTRLKLSVFLAFVFLLVSVFAQMTQKHTELMIKGCVQFHGGSYILETEKGKEIALTGSDVSGHVGHEVILKGDWVGGHAHTSTYSGPVINGQRESPYDTRGTTTNTFHVSSVKKTISESCKSEG